MRGIILAGGTGSRLYPLTKVINKHLIPVGGIPMIYHAIYKMVNAGITDILIVTGIEHCWTIISQCGDGSDFNCKFTYKVQTQAGGIAQALLLAEDFVQHDKCCVILGDNIFNKNIKNDVQEFDSHGEGAKIFLKEVKDPSRFGVANGYRKTSMENTQLIVEEIEEKPKNPKSNLAVTGIYFYDSTVFQKIKSIQPSVRGELEITDVNNLYIKDNQMTAVIMGESEWWTDAGTIESLTTANNLVNG